MRRWMWSFGLAGLGLGSLAMVGGTTVGGDIGPLAAGYGALVVATALYLIAGLAIRDRVWRRAASTRQADPRPSIDRLAGRRVF